MRPKIGEYGKLQSRQGRRPVVETSWTAADRKAHSHAGPCTSGPTAQWDELLEDRGGSEAKQAPLPKVPGAHLPAAGCSRGTYWTLDSSARAVGRLRDPARSFFPDPDRFATWRRDWSDHGGLRHRWDAGARCRRGVPALAWLCLLFFFLNGKSRQRAADIYREVL